MNINLGAPPQGQWRRIMHQSLDYNHHFRWLSMSFTSPHLPLGLTENIVDQLQLVIERSLGLGKDIGSEFVGGSPGRNILNL